LEGRPPGHTALVEGRLRRSVPAPASLLSCRPDHARSRWRTRLGVPAWVKWARAVDTLHRRPAELNQGIECPLGSPRLSPQELARCLKLQDWISAGQEEETVCQTEIDALAVGIENERNISRHNRLVRSYNQILQQERSFLARHNSRVDEFNRMCSNKCYTESTQAAAMSQLTVEKVDFGAEDPIVKYCDQFGQQEMPARRGSFDDILATPSRLPALTFDDLIPPKAK
jgi:hypothetical protein